MSGLRPPLPRRVESAPNRVRKVKRMNNKVSLDGDTPHEDTDLQNLLRRLDVVEHNERDMLFLLRTLHLALHNVRVHLSPETKRIHRAIIRMAPFNGRCPACLDTPVVSERGVLLPPAEYDHFLGPVYNAPVHTWLICQVCHQALSNDTHLTWYHQMTTRFRAYQAAAAAYTAAFGHRTPARLYSGTRTPTK
jgi:hypothetical protein